MELAKQLMELIQWRIVQTKLLKYIHGNLLANSAGLLSAQTITGILNLSGCKSFNENVTEPICLLAYLLPGNS